MHGVRMPEVVRVELYVANKSVRLGARMLVLNQRNWALFRLLAEHAGKIVTYRTINRALFRKDTAESNAAVAQKKRLAERIASRAPEFDGVVQCVHGHGLMLDLPASAVAIQTAR